MQRARCVCPVAGALARDHSLPVITEIPTAAEFHNAGLNLLFLAWDIAVEPEFTLGLAEQNGFDGDEEAIAAYWVRVQPQLGNGFGLIQQAMELALKGRIAAVSPFLLLSRDPKSWPTGVDSKPTPFSDFHTLDAADLVKVHNAVAPQPLPVAFAEFFDSVRRQRNRLMHSVPKHSFTPSTLLKNLLSASEYLFHEKTWAAQLVEHSEDDSAFVVGANYAHERNELMAKLDVAIGSLTPADAKKFFGFNKKKRAYLCPNCCDHAYTKAGDEHLPHLSQLVSKAPSETKISCILCEEITTVSRIDCVESDCKGNVIAEDKCLTCHTWQA